MFSEAHSAIDSWNKCTSKLKDIASTVDTELVPQLSEMLAEATDDAKKHRAAASDSMIALGKYLGNFTAMQGLYRPLEGLETRSALVRRCIKGLSKRPFLSAGEGLVSLLEKHKGNDKDKAASPTDKTSDKAKTETD